MRTLPRRSGQPESGAPGNRSQSREVSEVHLLFASQISFSLALTRSLRLMFRFKRSGSAPAVVLNALYRHRGSHALTMYRRTDITALPPHVDSAWALTPPDSQVLSEVRRAPLPLVGRAVYRFRRGDLPSPADDDVALQIDHYLYGDGGAVTIWLHVPARTLSREWRRL